jgi:hypothetical protein
MIAIDERHWPLVVFRFSGGVSLEELERYLKRQDEFMARGQRTVSLVIAEKLGMWEPRVMRRQAEWIKQHEQALRETALGVAMVMPSPVVRGMLKALLWMQPMPQPHAVVSTAAEGLAWLRKRCLEAGAPISIPTAL